MTNAARDWGATSPAGTEAHSPAGAHAHSPASGAPAGRQGPLWAQVLDDLRRRLAEGEFTEHFPSDLELTQSYGCSRHTVREAVRRLQSDGLVERRRGLGSRLAPSEFEQPLHSLYSLARTVEATGERQRSEVRGLEVLPARAAPATVAMHLCLDPDDPVVAIERLRFGGAEPLSLERSWLPERATPGIQPEDLTDGSLYDLLAERWHHRVTGGWERIRPVVPSAEESRVLRLPLGEAAFLVERLALAGELPIEWRRSLTRGDRYCFRADWAPAPGAGSPAQLEPAVGAA